MIEDKNGSASSDPDDIMWKLCREHKNNMNGLNKLIGMDSNSLRSKG